MLKVWMLRNIPFWSILIFLLFFSDVKMAHDDFPISEKYYTPITCFLTFNLCAVLGNLIPSILRFVRITYLIFIFNDWKLQDIFRYMNWILRTVRTIAFSHSKFGSINLNLLILFFAISSLHYYHMYFSSNLLLFCFKNPQL